MSLCERQSLEIEFCMYVPNPETERAVDTHIRTYTHQHCMRISVIPHIVALYSSPYVVICSGTI